MKCKKHKRYQAKRPPRIPCEICWRAWIAAVDAAKPKPARREAGGIRFITPGQTDYSVRGWAIESPSLYSPDEK